MASLVIVMEICLVSYGAEVGNLFGLTFWFVLCSDGYLGLFDYVASTFWFQYTMCVSFGI